MPAPKRITDNIFAVAYRLLILVTVIFLILPIVVSIAMGFDSRNYLGPFPPADFSLQWFAKFFRDDQLLKGLRTSLILAAVTALVSTTVGALAAFGLDRTRFWGRDLMVTFFLSPLIVPGVVIGFGLLLFFSVFDLFEGLPRLIAGHVLITIPYCLRTTLAALVGIKRSLTEAALSLGATERQALWEITFPLARTGIIAGAIFAFAISMDDVVVALFLVDPTTYTLPIALVSLMRSNFDLTLAAASTLLVVVTAIIIFVLERTVGLRRIIGQGVYRS